MLSGVLAVFLGATALGAVVVLHFPDLLTTADFRAHYSVPVMRALIELVIGVAFLCSCLNLLLRRRKALGLTALVLTLAAVVLGGADVAIRGDFDRGIHFGLDWFLLNLLVFAVVFVPLERAFALRPEQRVLRAGWATDVGYFFVNHVGIQLPTFLALWPATALARAAGLYEVSRLVSSQPIWLQVLELMLLADLTQYWVHRGLHRLPLLWRYHAIHHSIRELDWLAGSRLHLVDLVVTPRFHYWHHAVSPPDRNFAVHFPWLDRLFHTHYLPDDRWPDELGIAGHPVPLSFAGQLMYPLRRS